MCENKNHHILHSLKILTEQIEKKANYMLKQDGLTLAQGHLLRCIKKNEDKPCSLKDIEKQMNIAQSTLAGIVLRLEKKNLVKTYFSECDKRIKMIEITENGLQAMQCMRSTFVELENTVFANLTDIEKTLFTEVIDKLLKNL